MDIPDSSPSSTLEIRLFYVRLSPCGHSSAIASTSAPSHLTLDLTGHRILTLRRDRLDRTAGEATYVSTESLRLPTSSEEFEVSDERGNLLLCGSIEQTEPPWSNGKNTPWTMACYSALSTFSGKIDVEVYIAGSFAGMPVILTQTVQLSPRRKPSRSLSDEENEDLDYYDDEDGQVSWFNAGVRVGVGIGLGMCVGMGIAVGLLMRSYQATTHSFKRRFF